MTKSVKEEVLSLLDKLPDDMTWDDLMHAMYVRQAIESGLADSDAGRVKDVEQVSAELG
jgi:predicted transcriptional regulator